MFDLHELSTEEDESAGKLDEIINTLKEKDTGNLEEFSDDDTIVLTQTDEDESPKECYSEKNGKNPNLSKQDLKTSHTSITSNKGTSKEGYSRKKQPSENSAKVLKVDVNLLKTKVKKNVSKHQDVKDNPQNELEVKIVGKGRKVFAPNINSQTARFLRKQPPSAILSLPEATTNEASTFSSLQEMKPPSAEEKPSEESIVEKRDHRADTVQPSRLKQTKRQCESDEEKEESKKGPSKFKEAKEMMNRMGSVVILVQRLCPQTIAQLRITEKRKPSLSEEGASSSVESPLSDKDVPFKLEENKLAEVETSMDETDSKSTKGLTRRRREVGLANANETPANKRPRISEKTATITSINSDSDDSVFLEDHSPVTDKEVKKFAKGDSSSNYELKEQESSAEILVPAARPRRGRPRKAVTPVLTNKNVSNEDRILPADQQNTVVSPKSKKPLVLPVESKRKVHSKSSDESDEGEVSTANVPSTDELIASEGTDVEFIDQNAYSSNEDSSLKGKSSKRGRGRPTKNAASKSAISSDPLLLADEKEDKQKKPWTRPMGHKRPVESEKLDTVLPQKKKLRLSEETAKTTIVESDEEVEDLDKGDADDIQQEVSTAVVRRGQSHLTKVATSSEKTIVKSPVVTVAIRSTRKTPSSTPESQLKCCNVLLERDPKIDAMGRKNLPEKKSTEKVAAAKPDDEIPAKRATKVTRGTKKLASKSEPDVKIAPPLSPPRKLRIRQI